MKDTDDNLHHLSHDRNTGRWEMRITITRGRKLVGERIRVKLGRCSEDEAVRQRDTVLQAYQKAGVSVRQRTQRRRGR